MREGNGGGCDRPRSFIIIAIWAQALCWPRIAEIPLQRLVSAVALVLCIHTGVYELLAHDEWGGSSFLFRKAISASCERGMEGVVTGRVHRNLGAGFVLAENRGSTVTSAQVSRCGSLASVRRQLPV